MNGVIPPPLFPEQTGGDEQFKTNAADGKNTRGCALLLGGFDGLHKGHERLLSAAKQSGLPVAAICISGGKGVPLFTNTERNAVFFNNGISAVYPLIYDKIRNVTAREFAREVRDKIAPARCFCGEDFRFGAGGKADGRDFEAFSGVPVSEIPVLKDEKTGEKIGSEQIKSLLAAGDVQAADALLSGGFFLTGEVIKDRGVGRTIGYPTANIRYPEGKFVIKRGVYETAATIAGKEYKGITNFGARPTFFNDAVITETHFLNFSGDLYGATLTLYFKRFLREISAFKSAEELKMQLDYDKRRVINSD